MKLGNLQKLVVFDHGGGSEFLYSFFKSLHPSPVTGQIDRQKRVVITLH